MGRFLAAALALLAISLIAPLATSLAKSVFEGDFEGAGTGYMD